MVLALLILSLGWVFIAWLLATMSDCGLTIGMLIAYPFIWLWEKLFPKKKEEDIPDFSIMTDEERREYLDEHFKYDPKHPTMPVYNKHFDRFF